MIYTPNQIIKQTNETHLKFTKIPQSSTQNRYYRLYIHKKSGAIATICFILPKFATCFLKSQQTQ